MERLEELLALFGEHALDGEGDGVAADQLSVVDDIQSRISLSLISIHSPASSFNVGMSSPIFP